MDILIASAYTLFVVGYLLHMMLQIDAIVRAKNNAAFSRWTTINQNLFPLLARFFISLLVLVFLRSNPQYLAALLSLIGIPATNVVISTQSALFAGAYGYCADSILAFIPWLKNQVPQLNGKSD